MPRWPQLLFLGTALLYLAGQVVPARFMGTDEIAFKSAGRHWAKEGVFAAPDLDGFLGPSLEPPVSTVFGVQPPLYPFLYGLFTRVFGFGERVNSCFDAILHCGFGAAAVLLARFRAPLAPGAAAMAGMIALAVPAGGRPEELAGILGVLALVPVTGPSVKRMWSIALGGLALGVSAFAQPVAAVAIALAGTIIVLIENPWRGGSKIIAAWAAAAMITSSIGLWIVSASLPGAVSQFLFHARLQRGASMLSGFVNATAYHRQWALVFAAGLIACSSTAWKKVGALWWNGAWLPVLVPAAALFLFQPEKTYYQVVLVPVLAGALAGSIHTLWALGNRRKERVSVFAVGVLLFCALILDVRNVAIVLSLEEDQQVDFNEQLLDQMIPTGSVVIGNDLWPSLANRVQFRSSSHSQVPAERIDFVLLTGNGSGRPGQHQKLQGVYTRLLEGDWVIIHDGISRRVPEVMGVPLSRSSWGFGFILYKRAKAG